MFLRDTQMSCYYYTFTAPAAAAPPAARIDSWRVLAVVVLNQS